MDNTGTAFQGKNGGLAIDTYDDLLKSIHLYNKNRFLNHIEKKSNWLKVMLPNLSPSF